MKRILLVLALAVAGCDDSSPTRLPDVQVLCPFELTWTPIAGFPGLYYVQPSISGEYTVSVNGVARSVEFGALVTAEAGDVVQGCRACGCSRAVVVR